MATPTEELTTDKFERMLLVLADKYNLYPYRTAEGAWIMSNGSANIPLGDQSSVRRYLKGGRPCSIIEPAATLRDAVTIAVESIRDRSQHDMDEARDHAHAHEQELAVLMGLG